MSARIAENFAVFDFELTQAGRRDRGPRYGRGPDSDSITLENYGKAIPEA
jgi:hypothetical protein